MVSTHAKENSKLFTVRASNSLCYTWNALNFNVYCELWSNISHKELHLSQTYLVRNTVYPAQVAMNLSRRLTQLTFLGFPSSLTSCSFSPSGSCNCSFWLVLF